MDYVKENSSSNITLKMVASHFYINSAYLGRVFKKVTGELFQNYINRIRIELAKNLLFLFYLSAVSVHR